MDKPKQKENKPARKSLKHFRNKNVTRARRLYLFFIFGGIAGFLYAISTIFTKLPVIYSIAPIVVIIGYILFVFLKKNWKMLWVFIRNIERGRLLIVLNETTHWSYEHKMKVLHWVYPGKRYIRNERRLELNNKLSDGEKFTKEERREIRKKIATCPQQLLDGFNKAILVNALIWSHKNIQVLDDEIREILDLTDNHMDSFSLKRETERIMNNKNEHIIEQFKNRKKKKDAKKE